MIFFVLFFCTIIKEVLIDFMENMNKMNQR